MKHVLKILSAVALGAGLFTPPAQANLLVNGDFATGDLTGWTETNSCCNYVGTPGDTSYGSGQGFHEGAVSSNGMLSQTFTDTAGSELFVSFNFASNDGSSYQYVSLNGVTVPGTLISGPTNLTSYTFDLGPATGLDTITFNGQDNPSYNWLSDVVVTEVPEPATVALLGMSLAGFGVARRRR